MSTKQKFPVTLVHDKVNGETTAKSPSSLRALQRRGWKPKPAGSSKSGRDSNSG